MKKLNPAQKPRLLIATDNFLPRWDGIARFLNELIPGLSQEFSITILAPKFEGNYSAPKGAKVHRFDTMKKSFGDINFSIFDYKKTKKHVQDCDLVLAGSLGPIGICTIFAASKLKKPCLYYVHSIDWELTSNSVKRFKSLTRLLTKLINWYFYRKVKTLMVPDKEVKKIITTQLHLDKRIEIVRLGIDTNKFIPPEDKRWAKKRVGIPPESTVIGYYGRISREKSLLTLLEAYKKVRKKHPNCKLLVVGDGVPDIITKLDEQDGVILTGSVNNGEHYLQAMDIYVLPSLTETTSFTTLEAMSCGLPVISTKVGYVKEYIKENHNGLFFPKENALVLSLKIGKLLDAPQKMLSMGEHARGTVLRKFKWEITENRIRDLLREYSPRLLG